MGMSTHVIGFKSVDEKWKAMKAVYDACVKAGIEVPSDVYRFFNYQAPDGMGVEVSVEATSACRKWRDDHSREGFEIDVKALDPDVKILRFYNSW